jgi:hypothetical protein
MDSTIFFTYKDDKEGNVAIGILPDRLITILDNIKIVIPEVAKNKSTFHSWYDNMEPQIKEQIDLLKNDEHWNQLNDGKLCEKINVNEMDELYISNPPNNLASKNLYGAAGNFDIHRDCILFKFSGIRFYRVLIGLTNNNSNIVTHFNKSNLSHKINRNDYIAFDFNRTTHQVIKETNVNTERSMLKLHFLICENSSNYSKRYIQCIKQLYIYYEYIFRYINETGTDPITYYQFFLGTLYQFGMKSYTKYVVLGLYILFKLMHIKYSVLTISGLYLLMVLCYWLRYNLFLIR